MRVTHGATKTRTYGIWRAMRKRCSVPTTAGYARYGGRGIRVDPRWGRFETFLADMGKAPPGMSIERDDNDGDYAPGNCRWATSGEQQRNTRRNRMVTHNGETLCVADWAAREGVTWAAIYRRIKRKGSPI